MACAKSAHGSKWLLRSKSRVGYFLKPKCLLPLTLYQGTYIPVAGSAAVIPAVLLAASDSVDAILQQDFVKP